MIYKKKKGSILVFSLIVLAIVLSSALSVAVVNVSNRKSAASTAQSVLSFQVADSAAEKILKTIYNGNKATLTDLATSLHSECVNGQPFALTSVVTTGGSGATAQGTAIASFYDTTGAMLPSCTSTTWRDDLARIKVEGSANGATRVIETAIAPLSSLAWGDGVSGRLGTGNTASVNVTAPVSTTGGSKWRMVSAGSAHTLALKSDGTLWVWGDDSSGQLGNGTGSTEYSPVPIGTDTWIWVSAGEGHSLGIKTGGALFAWGDGGSYRLGDNSTQIEQSPRSISNCSDGGSNVACPIWKSVAAGKDFSLAIDNSDRLWTWGASNHHQTGDSASTADKRIPTRITVGPPGWKFISAGDSHSLGIGSDDKLYSWGYNATGQLGNGGTNEVSSPTAIPGTDTWIAVSAGGGHSLGIQTNGTLYAWGNNANGQLGDESTTTRTSRVQIGTDSWVWVSAGNIHSLGVKTNGTLFSWGDNGNGRLGLGGSAGGQQTSPQSIGSNTNWRVVSAGSDFSIAVRQ